MLANIYIDLVVSPCLHLSQQCIQEHRPVTESYVYDCVGENASLDIGSLK